MSNTPSKAEIEKLAAEHLKAFSQFPMGGQVWFEGEVEFARAVLAKWGTPQPVAREPVSPRHPVVMQWRDNAIEACAKIADAYGHEHAAQDMRAMLTAPQQEAQEPALFVSAKQLADLVDPSHATGGSYLPARKTRAGLFTQPLYSAPQPAPAPLSRERVKEIMRENGYDGASVQHRADFINGVRHAEIAHGISAALAAQGDTP